MGFGDYDAWKLRSPDGDDYGDDPEPELEDMDEWDWLEKFELEASGKSDGGQGDR